MKLKPCPFCGGKASYMTYINDGRVFTRSRNHIYFKCKNCEAQTKAFPESVHYSAEEKAMEAWNKRVGEEDETSVCKCPCEYREPCDDCHYDAYRGHGCPAEEGLKDERHD